eukprot:scaffold1620_cov124-Skeletonema_menzelii.AAC.6
MRCIVALICILCFVSVRVIAADKQQIIILEEEGTCSKDGYCEPPQTTLQKIIFYDVNNGSLTINAQQTYTEPFHQFGTEVAVHLRDIIKNMHLLGSLADDNFHDLVHRFISLTNNLTALVAVHKLEWLYGSSVDPVALQSETFDKTVVICKAVLRLFNLLQLHAPKEEETSDISTGISSAALVLGDLFQQRPSMDLSAVIEDDYSTAYQYFTFAEEKIVKSLSAMGIDQNGNSITNGHENNDGQEDEVHLLVLDDVLSVLAEINLRFGSLLLEMYLLGFTIDHANNLHHHVPSGFDMPMQQLSENQKQILHIAFAKLETSTVIHKKIKFSSDVLMSQADAYSRMGTVNSLLHEWALSVKHCKLGLSMLSSALAHKSQNGEMMDEIFTTMITTTQTIFEAYLHLPGEMESAKDAFRRHLLARQAAEVGDVNDVFEKELTNEDEEEVRQLLLLTKDATPPVVDSTLVRESLNMYQNMLEETMQSGMQYAELDINGGAAYNNRDILYEGSLRSVIGSLWLDLNEPWKARDELESAVQLLQEGIELVDSGKYEVISDDGSQSSQSPRLDLAHVLYSLSFTYLDLMQWEKSYEIFEGAMDIYQSELPDGQSPIDWLQMASGTTSSARESTSITDKLMNFFFKETQDEIELEDFQQVVNTTA